jgi:O-acetyl-ADP-ribose deacetylase (regulator of RNase III)
MEIFISKAILSIQQGDITNQSTDAIVNAANPSLMGGGGVDGAIHRAGGSTIIEECKIIISRQGRLPTGKAVTTTAGRLKSRYVIHTVGPVWHGGHSGEAALLSSAYRESLEAAVSRNLTSISFPSISTGVYGYPVEKAAHVALKTIIIFLKERISPINEVVLVLFDSSTYISYCRELQRLTAVAT